VFWILASNVQAIETTEINIVDDPNDIAESYFKANSSGVIIPAFNLLTVAETGLTIEPNGTTGYLLNALFEGGGSNQFADLNVEESILQFGSNWNIQIGSTNITGNQIGTEAFLGQSSSTGIQYQITNSNAGATGVQEVIFHNSSTPAASDVLWTFTVKGRDTIGTAENYGTETVAIVLATNGNEQAKRTWTGIGSESLFEFNPGSQGALNLASGSFKMGGTEVVSSTKVGTFAQLVFGASGISGSGNYNTTAGDYRINNNTVIDSSRAITAVRETLTASASGSSPVQTIRTGTSEGNSNRQWYQIEGYVASGATTTVGTITLPSVTAGDSEWAWSVVARVTSYDSFADDAVWYEKRAGYRGTATALTEQFELYLVEQETDAGSGFVMTPVASSKNIDLIFTNGSTGGMNVTITVEIDSVGD